MRRGHGVHAAAAHVHSGLLLITFRAILLSYLGENVDYAISTQ